MKKKVFLCLFPILTIWLAIPNSSEGQVFKWVDKNGDTHYTDNFYKGPRHKEIMVPPPKQNLKKNPDQNVDDSKNIEEEAKDNLIHLNEEVTQCQDLAENLDQCLPYTCQQSQPLFRRIIINHIISGMNDGKCRYEQTFSISELVTCEFSEDQRKKFALQTNNLYSGKTVEGVGLEQGGNKKVGYFVDEALRNGDCLITRLEN